MAILKVDTISGIGTEGPVFEGDIEFTSQNFLTLPKGDTAQRGRGRAVLFGGNIHPVSPSRTSNIDYVEMRSSGVGVRFGDMAADVAFMGSFSSSTRGISFGGQPASPNGQTDTIEFVTISTESNATDFGNLDRARRQLQGMGHSNQTRGILAGGGGDAPLAPDNVIQFVTIATTGNASDFGDVSISESIRGHAAGSNAIRGVYGGGIRYPSGVQTGLEFITLATLGNGKTFGDLTYSGRQEGGGCASGTRAVFGGAYSPSAVNTMNYVQIMTTGDAVDFGDLTVARGTGALSNGHGGLG